MSDIIAIHNISERRLMDLAALGGLAAPHIAVQRARMPLDDYGEISLIMKPEKLDPGADSRNALFNAPSPADHTPTLLYLFEQDQLEKAVLECYGARLLPGSVEKALGKETGYRLSVQADHFRTFLLQNPRPDLGEAADFLDSHYAEKGLLNTHTSQFTAAGGRRDFRQIALPYTLENLTEAKKETFFREPEFHNALSLQAFLCGRAAGFGSIEEERLFERRSDICEWLEIFRDYDTMMNLIRQEIRNPRFADRMAGDLMEDIGAPTAEEIRRAFSDEGFRLTRFTADIAAETAQKVMNMRVPYLELWPRRSVGFDEVAAAVIPERAAPVTAEFLKNQDIDVLVYDHPAHRTEAVLEAVSRNPQALIDPAAYRAKELTYTDVRRRHEEAIPDLPLAMEGPHVPYSADGSDGLKQQRASGLIADSRKRKTQKKGQEQNP